ETGVALEQRPISITRNAKQSASLNCKILNPVSDYVHWYRSQEGRAPERLLVYSRSKSESVPDPGFSADKVRAYKGADDTCRLIVSDLQVSDSGVYHCASWDGRVKVFGEGTRLIVTESAFKKKPPKPIFFLPTSEEIKQKQSGTYICLLEDFFPNVVKTYWKEDGNSQPLDAQFGPITGGGNSYSQVSWLTVKEDVLRKNLTYFYQHEDLGMEPKAFSISSVREKGSLVPR
uniref:T cell receptor gamma chain n=1 Tax=Monodelphis domestica TaxID=13616 RepID=UPI001AA00CE6|nr:Chain B, T cell receptor gamma chain [Monodelphis domestica]7K0X_D Chain D, T cell receptor gamma chain [Monodelphis domestica]